MICEAYTRDLMMNCCKYKLHGDQVWRHKKTKRKVFIYSAYENGVYWNQGGKQKFNRIDDFILHYEKLPTFWQRLLGFFKRGDQ